MLAPDLALLIDAAREAGQIAAKYFRQSLDIRDKGDGQGPVTQADLEIDRFLSTSLRRARPEYGWLSEESEDDPARLGAERVFIVDPIDGTRAFIEGQRTFATALAIAEAGVITQGVVHLPMREETYAASLGQGAYLNGQRLAVSATTALPEAHILAGRANLEARHWKAGTAPGFTRHMRPSLAYRMSLVAEGRFDAMLTLRDSWEWDIAAGTLIVQEAGGVVTTQAGGKALFNNPRPMLPGIVCAGRPLHGLLSDALA